MTVREYARVKGVSPKTVYRWIGEKKVGWDGLNVTDLPESVTLDVEPVTSDEEMSQPEVSNVTPPNFTSHKMDGRFGNDEDRQHRGRGVVVNGMVRVSTDPDDSDLDIMISESDWRARMVWKCPHGLMGWSCTNCINGVEAPIKTNPLQKFWDDRLDRELGPVYLTGETHKLIDGRVIELRRRSKEPKAGWVPI